jgi:hypothetical protein
VDARVQNPTTTAWIMDPMINIPAGASNYESVSQFTFMDDGWILGLVPHMHLRGKDFEFVADYPDGRSETLLRVPRYDFNWQIAYTMAEPKAIPKGTKIRAIAHWDNSADNPNNPDPTVNVTFGEATTDEMMIGFMEYAYNERKNLQGKFGFPEGFGGAFPGFGAFGGGSESREFAEKIKERAEQWRTRRVKGTADGAPSAP